METSNHTDTKYIITTCPKCKVECHTLYGIKQHKKSCTKQKSNIQLSKEPEEVENTEVASGPTAKCRICPQKFFLYKTLLDHYKQKHPQGNGLKNLKRKIKRKYGKHECRICHRKFAWKSSLEKHTSLMHSESSEAMMNNTVQNDTLIKSPLPSGSNVDTPNKPSSNSNQQTNQFTTFNGKFKCTGCSKIYLVPSKLLQHIKEQPSSAIHNSKMYKETISQLNHICICENCDTLFYTPENFIKHIKNDHNGENLAKHIAYAYRHANGY